MTISKASNGKACTYVVQEYKSLWRISQYPYLAQVEFIDRRQRENLMKDCLKQCYNTLVATSEEMEDIDILLGYKSQAMTSLEILKLLFCNRKEFNSKEAALVFLRTAQSEDDPDILRVLNEWTNELLEAYDITSDCIETEGASIDDISRGTMIFTNTVEFDDFEDPIPSLWPLVKVVRIGLDSPLLKQDIVLADLPGISDKNRHRVAVTKSYMENVDYTIVVGRIQRAVDDESIQRNLFAGSKRKIGQSVMLVCTHSDNIGEEPLSRSALDQNERRKYNEIEEQMDNLRARETEVTQHLRVVGDDRSRVNDLRDQKDVIAERKTTAEREMSELKVLHRNRKVSNSLKLQFREFCDDPHPLPVFCVSNKAYAQYLCGFELRDKPFLSIESTNIPKLRAVLYALPSECKTETLEYFCRFVVPNKLNMLEISCAESRMHRIEQLDNIVSEAAKVSQAKDLITTQLTFRRKQLKIYWSHLTASVITEVSWLTALVRQCSVSVVALLTQQQLYANRNGSITHVKCVRSGQQYVYTK
jgi:hypothetical protein